MIKALRWALGLIVCLAALQGARWIKWTRLDDVFYEIKQVASELRPFILQDSLTTILASGVPEDYMLYMRYQLVPARVAFHLRPECKQILIIAPRQQIVAVADSVGKQVAASIVRFVYSSQLGVSLLQLK